jgi:hypothetical protein
MRRAALLILISLAACSAALTQTARRGNARPRDAVTGQYVLRYSNVRGNLNVQLLPNSRIRFSLVALLETGGGTRNGVAEGTIPLKDNSAVYQEGECRISMRFLGDRVEVEESNVEDCGFGAFVTARGTYNRKSRRPRFDQ